MNKNTSKAHITTFIIGIIMILFFGIGLSACSNKSSELEQRVKSLEEKVNELESKEKSSIEKNLLTDQDNTTSANDFSQHLSSKKFVDLQDVPAKKYIDDLLKLGFYDNFGDEFKPYDNITRGEYITWLFKAVNLLRSEENRVRMAPQAKPFFKDLAKNHPAYPYVQAMSYAGYAVGYEDGTFKADQPITREEMIAIKVGVDTGKKYEEPSYYHDISFSDKDKVDKRYRGYIYEEWGWGSRRKETVSDILRAFGMIKTLNPQQPVLRFEAAATLWEVGDGMNAKNSIEKLAQSGSQ